MTAFLSTLKRLLMAGDGHEDLRTPAELETEFRLALGHLRVGSLSLKSGRWFFRYSEEFRSQSEISPLVDFPNVEKIYESDTLWPFFSVRIPSLEQPETRRVIRKENLDDSSQVELLERFGKTSIANPFRLEMG